MRPGQQRSIVWQFFQKSDDKKHVICTLCKTQLNYYGSTTNLQVHLKRKHSIEYNGGPTEFNLNYNEETLKATNTILYCNKNENIFEDIPEPEPKGRKPRSIVWKFFKKTKDTKFVICCLCKKKLSYCASTTNLKQHIVRLHPLEYSASESEDQINLNFENIPNFEVQVIVDTVEDNTQPGTTSNFYFQPDTTANNLKPIAQKRKSIPKPLLQLERYNPKRKPNLSQSEKNDLNRSLIKMIVTDYQSLSLVENTGFLEYSKKLNPWYTPPSKNSLTNQVLPEIFREVVTKIKLILDSIDYISLTTDNVWTSASNRSYLTVTGHFVYNHRIHSQVLNTREMSNHTEENMTEVILNILQEWNIEKKIVAIVSHNQDNIKNVITKCLHKTHQPCIAYTLNSSVNTALTSSENARFLEIIKTCRELVGHFQETVLVTDDLNDYLFKVEQDALEKWKSCLLMMERLLEMKEEDPLSNLPWAPELFLDASDWETLSDCVSVLKPLETMTKELSEDKYTSLSLVIPLVRGLQYAIKQLSPKTDVGLELQRTLIDVIARQFGSFESNEIAAKATFLDPRFKITAFDLEDNAKNAQQWIADELQEILNCDTNMDMAQTAVKGEYAENKSSLWLHFETKLAKVKTTVTTGTTISLMIRHYLELPYLDRTQNPLEFWEKYKCTLPGLYQLHLKYFSIPATSVPSEWVFSERGEIVSHQRSQLSSKHLNKIIFLNSYF